MHGVVVLGGCVTSMLGVVDVALVVLDGRITCMRGVVVVALIENGRVMHGVVVLVENGRVMHGVVVVPAPPKEIDD